jgi:hypothetical protein
MAVLRGAALTLDQFEAKYTFAGRHAVQAVYKHLQRGPHLQLPEPSIAEEGEGDNDGDGGGGGGSGRRLSKRMELPVTGASFERWCEWVLEPENKEDQAVLFADMVDFSGKGLVSGADLRSDLIRAGVGDATLCMPACMIMHAYSLCPTQLREPC